MIFDNPDTWFVCVETTLLNFLTGSEDMEKDSRVKKIAAPSVSQINAEYVTQVRQEKRYTVLFCLNNLFT